MKIAVCLSNVPDTTTKIKFVNGKNFDTAGVQWIINPWDELALTRAMELKETAGTNIESITVITVGLAHTEPTIRKALAIGADEAIRVNLEPLDSYSTASQIAMALKDKNFDLILAGADSSDYNGFSTGSMVATLLNIPVLSAVTGLQINNNSCEIKREIDGGYEKISGKFPLVAVVQKGIAINPRIPAMRGIMTARTKKIEVLEPANVLPMIQFENFELPKAKAACKLIGADNVPELIALLRNEAKVI